MGVFGLWQEIRKRKIEIGVAKAKRDFENRRLAIDVSFWLQGSIRGSAHHGYNRAKKPHLSTLFRRISSLLACGVKPVVVFDGPDFPKQKQRCASSAQASLSQVVGTKLTYKESRVVGSSQGSPRRATVSFCYSSLDPVIQECKDMLDLLGVPYICSPGEAEAQCAWMEQKNMVDGTITLDGDYFLFGGCNLYRMNFKLTYPQCKIVRFHHFISETKLRNREELIMASMLAGCDYTLDGVKKIGFVKAQLIIQHFRRSEEGSACLGLLHSFRDHCLQAENIPREKQSRWQKLGVIFPVDFPSSDVFQLYMSPNIAVEKFLPQDWAQKMKLVPENVPGLIRFAQSKMKWKPERVNKDIRRIKKQKEERKKIREKEERKRLEDLRKKKQRKVTDYFVPTKKNISSRKTESCSVVTKREMPDRKIRVSPRKRPKTQLPTIMPFLSKM